MKRMAGGTGKLKKNIIIKRGIFVFQSGFTSVNVRTAAAAGGERRVFTLITSRQKGNFLQLRKNVCKM